MTSNYPLMIALIPLLPIAVFLLLGLFGKKCFKSFSGIFGTTVMLISAVLSIVCAWQYFFDFGKVDGVYRSFVLLKTTWLEFKPGVSIDMGMTIDPISVMMLVVVSFVSLMVHLFSLGYMKGEDRYPSYFAFLSLFSFSMLGLVLSCNIFQIYIFWELVGISSYLLIGFYFIRPSAVAASKKAFIVTRFADLGFLIGILILSFYAHTLDFHTLIASLSNPSTSAFASISGASFLGGSMLTWGLVLIFAGCAGKSAMFPLHVWLPDAMEGPTPVSALIHAATMVVAGVFLVARLFPVFSIDGTALLVVRYVGVFTALFAAIIACTQTDIKRVLAFSTISQIGYMMFALGVSGTTGEHGLGYMASMFHLFTHAFFKSLLFLCAGAIIHIIGSNEMSEMGGLRKKMPITHIAFLIACLAISGVPPFSGFFSKEEILSAAFQTDKLVYFVGLFTAGLTAFYMFRIYFGIFWNKSEAPAVALHHSNEGPWVMMLPLILLSILTILTGFLPFSHLVTFGGIGFESHINWGMSIAPIVLALIGIIIAGYLYKTESGRADAVSNGFGSFYKWAKSKFYMDEIWLFFTKKIMFNLIGRPAAWFDRHVVDGFMNLLARITLWFSYVIRFIQSGKIQSYTLYFFGGVFFLAIIFIYLW